MNLTCHVDSVEVDVDGSPPEHGHHGVAVLLLDLVLENHLVRESNPPLSRVVPREDAGAPTHLGPVIETDNTCRSIRIKCCFFAQSVYI